VQLNHLDLQVPDVQRAATFFVTFFAFTRLSNDTSPALAILSDDHGFSLVLQKLRAPDERYPEGFHVGFLVDDVEVVIAFQRKAQDAGLDVSAVIRNARGTLVYCRTPDGLLVEVSVRSRPR
jgi:catechol 2,3-dioxygenase-like lactoylglutathione lyase family enzyme